MLPNTLFVSYYYPPVGGSSQPAINRISRMIRYLDYANGHVLTLRPDCYESPDPIGLSPSRPQRLTVHRTGTTNLYHVALQIRRRLQRLSSLFRDGNSLPSVPAPAESKKEEPAERTLSVLKDYVTSCLQYPDFAYPWLVPAIHRGLKIIRKQKIDLIVATGMPWTALIIAATLKFVTGVNLAVDFRDPWVNNPYLVKDALETYLDHKLEAWVTNSADLVVANTDVLAGEMKRRYPESSHKIITVTNGYDASDFEDVPDIQFSPDELVICHAGFLYQQRDPAPILKAISWLKRSNLSFWPTPIFLLIGERQVDYDVAEYSRKLGIKANVRLIDHLDYKTCLGHLKAADALVLIQPDTMTQVPSKLFEYVYLEKPIIAISAPNGALGQLINAYRLGRNFGLQDHEEIGEYLRELVEEKNQKHGIASPPADKGVFDARIQINVLQTHLESICR